MADMHSACAFIHIGETRFATNFLMLERQCVLQDALVQTVVDSRFKVWKHVDMEGMVMHATDRSGMPRRSTMTKLSRSLRWS